MQTLNEAPLVSMCDVSGYDFQRGLKITNKLTNYFLAPCIYQSIISA